MGELLLIHQLTDWETPAQEGCAWSDNLVLGHGAVKLRWAGHWLPRAREGCHSPATFPEGRDFIKIHFCTLLKGSRLGAEETEDRGHLLFLSNTFELFGCFLKQLLIL